MSYTYIQLGPNQLEDCTYEVFGDTVHVVHSRGVHRCKMRKGEDPKRAAQRVLRELTNERGTFSDPINYKPLKLV